MVVSVELSEELVNRFIAWLKDKAFWMLDAGIDDMLIHSVPLRQEVRLPVDTTTYSGFVLSIYREDGYIALRGFGGETDEYDNNTQWVSEGSIVYDNDRYYIARPNGLEPVIINNRLNKSIDEVIKSISIIDYELAATEQEFTSLYILVYPLLTWP